MISDEYNNRNRVTKSNSEMVLYICESHVIVLQKKPTGREQWCCVVLLSYTERHDLTTYLGFFPHTRSTYPATQD